MPGPLSILPIQVVVPEDAVPHLEVAGVGCGHNLQRIARAGE